MELTIGSDADSVCTQRSYSTDPNRGVFYYRLTPPSRSQQCAKTWMSAIASLDNDVMVRHVVVECITRRVWRSSIRRRRTLQASQVDRLDAQGVTLRNNWSAKGCDCLLLAVLSCRLINKLSSCLLREFVVKEQAIVCRKSSCKQSLSGALALPLCTTHFLQLFFALQPRVLLLDKRPSLDLPQYTCK
jgi:hypothetical protein